MKPNFALNLSHDSVQILQRAPTGWQLLGATRFDVPDLDAAMARLRARALDAAPEGIRAKLVIPESELRYATVPAPGPTDEARKLQIEAEIDGLTPYSIDDLVYDFVLEGEDAMVVICARETLAEAESFARAHDFNPVCFVAIPPRGKFSGEPFLGEARGAGKIARDSEPVRIITAPPARPASPGAASNAPPARAPADDQVLDPAALDPAVVASAGGAPAGPAGRVAAVAQAAAPEALSRVGDLVRRMGTRLRREQAQADTPNASAAKSDDARGSIAEAQAVTPDKTPAVAPDKAPAVTPAAVTPSASPPAAAKAPAPASPATPVAGPTPEAAKADLKPNAEAPEPTARSGAKPATPPSDAPAGAGAERGAEGSTIAFSSRRRPIGSAVKPVDTPTDAGTAKGPALVATGSGSPAKTPSPGGRLAVLPPAGETQRGGLLTRWLRRDRSSEKAAAKPVAAAAKPAAPQPAAVQPATATAATTATPPVTARDDAPLVPASRPPASERERSTEAQALTVFGARNHPRQETGFARRGLMLTGGLLLLLVAVAIWAAYFAVTPPPPVQGDDAVPLTGIEAPERIAAPDDTATPGPESVEAPQPVADGEAMFDDPADASPPIDPQAETLAEDSTAPGIAPGTAQPATDAGALSDPERMLEELVQEGLSEELPLDLLDRSADPVAAPEGPATSSASATAEPTQAPQLAEDTGFPTAERLNLPRPLEMPQRQEVAPVSLPPPPPFGTQFAVGPDGLVEATPEGALTPQGVTVTAGRPSEVPPPRPAGLAPEPPPQSAPETPEATADPAPEEEAAVQGTTELADGATTESPPETPPPDDAPLQPAAIIVADDTPRADPALADFRPLPRSPRVAETGAAATEGTTAGADTRTGTDASAETSAAPQTTDSEAASETGDDSSALPPAPGGLSLAALRPQQRPTDLVEPAVAATIAEGGTPEAVATSLVPSARPDDLSTRIQQALSEARQQPQTAATAAPAAAAPAAPAAAAGPQIPTSASVAERATQTRAINLRRINLVGVFGTPSDRRALVRLADGRVVRVQVGDSLDGGRVSAISDDELRYVKNGRNEVLRIGQRS
ncbi:MAG: type IV pilus biogenesis protein PilP [Pararhodobacter sp.]